MIWIEFGWIAMRWSRRSSALLAVTILLAACVSVDGGIEDYFVRGDSGNPLSAVQLHAVVPTNIHAFESLVLGLCRHDYD